MPRCRTEGWKIWGKIPPIMPEKLGCEKYAIKYGIPLHFQCNKRLYQWLHFHTMAHNR
jgi:hypothetical protein